MNKWSTVVMTMEFFDLALYRHVSWNSGGNWQNCIGQIKYIYLYQIQDDTTQLCVVQPVNFGPFSDFVSLITVAW
jgi:hypothetical protein